MMTPAGDGGKQWMPGGAITPSNSTAPSRLEAPALGAGEAQRPTDPEQVGDAIAAYVQRLATAAINARQATGVDQRLLESKRAWLGKYEADKLAQMREAGISTRYLNATGEKGAQIEAALREVVLPAYERPFGIAPRKRPELPPMDMQELAQAVYQRASEMMGGQQPTPELVHQLAGQTRDAMDDAVHKDAQERALRMEDLIVDQLQAGGYHTAMAEAIINFTWSLTTFMGMRVESRRVGEWVGGQFQMVEKPIWVFFAPDPLDMYFSPECGRFNEGYCLRRLRSTRAEVSRLKGVPGYDNIDKVLADHETAGDPATLPTDPQRHEIESKFVPGGVQGSSNDKIEGWEVTGTVNGATLLGFGMAPATLMQGLAPDATGALDHHLATVKTLEYDVVAVCYGRHTIKVMLNDDPQGKWGYVGTSFRKIPGSIWGQSEPEVLATPQAMINSGVRASQDNAAFGSRPMAMMNWTRLTKESRRHANILAPGTIYVVEEPQSGVTSIRPVEFFNVPLVLDELGRYIDRAGVLADRLSGFPSLAYGDSNVGQAAGTARGLAMLIKGASKLGRAMIGNFGTEMVLEIVKRLFYDNMLHVEDESIKGDCQVDARGTLQALLREDTELAAQEILELAERDPDVKAVIGGRLGVAKLIRQKAKSAEMFGLVLSDAEIVRQMQQEAAAAQAQAQAQAQQEAAPSGQPRLMPAVGQ